MFKSFINLFLLFSKKERVTFVASFFVFLITSTLLGINTVQTNTTLSPVEGGEYVEGIVGQPIFINPLFAENNAPDSDLSQLMFANMGAIAEKVTSGSDHQTYDIRLKGDIVWQDNQPLTTDDIIFTIQMIQDPDVNSSLATAWKGVQVERISEREMQIIVPSPYGFFENTLLTLQPIPKHLYENIPSANIRLSGYNIEPMGSGPYRFDSFEKRRDGFITQITVKKNDHYFGDKPYIKTIVTKFFANEQDAIAALNNGDIDGVSIVDPENLKRVSIPHLTRNIEMPRYYAIFPNAFANPLLASDDVRKALTLATDNVAITTVVFGNNAVPITSPTPPFTPEIQGIPTYSLENAKAYLEENGWHMTDSGVREKDGKRLEFVLTVYPIPFLQKTADLLVKQWGAAGIRLQVNVASLSNFNSSIVKPRDYELLLFGNNYGKNIDPYSFWHSSQKLAPGLNLSLYASKTADTIIENIQGDFDTQSRDLGMRQLQQVITQDKPAVFLYSPYYIYVTNKSLKGFDNTSLATPSDRFSYVNQWYTKTVRTLKK